VSSAWKFGVCHGLSTVVPQVTSGSYFAISCTFVNTKTIHQHTQREGTNCRSSSMATARTESTRGPTYSMTRVIQATPWQKGFICQCHCLCCHYSPLRVAHGPSSPLATSMSSRRECHLSVDTSCKAHGVLGPCACSNRTDRA